MLGCTVALDVLKENKIPISARNRKWNFKSKDNGELLLLACIGKIINQNKHDRKKISD